MITNAKLITIEICCLWVFESYVPTYLVQFAIAIGVSTDAKMVTVLIRSAVLRSGFAMKDIANGFFVEQFLYRQAEI